MTPVRNSSRDAYVLHKAALAPLFPGISTDRVTQAAEHMSTVDEDEFFVFLEHHGLCSFWHDLLGKADQAFTFSELFVNKLHQQRLATTGQYLLQKHALREIKSILDEENIAYVALKGAHTRELLYNDPSLRPACDIDVLIDKQQITHTASVLTRAGYVAHINKKNVGHEASFCKNTIDIDLHWDILRTGRTRTPLAEQFLTNRTEYPDHWGLDNETTLFMLLVHPVFTKYATSRNSSLVRLLDLALWMTQRTIDWDKALYWLEIAGNKTAAWITLEWLRQLTGTEANDWFMKNTEPGPLRKRFLQHWIRNNYSDRFLHRPVINQLMFTLPAHDRLADMFHAVTQLIREKRLAEEKSTQLTENLNGPDKPTVI